MGYLIKPIHMSEEAKQKYRLQAIEAGIRRMMDKLVEVRHEKGRTKSITIYDTGSDIPLSHSSVGDIVHYEDGSTKELKTLDDVSAWLKEWYFGNRQWKYDGVRNITRDRSKPAFTLLDEDHVKEMWQSGEGMIKNPIKKEA